MRAANIGMSGGALLVIGVLLPVACGGHDTKGTQGTKPLEPRSKPSCRLLYKRNTKCGTMPITAVFLTEAVFVRQCRTDEASRFETACSTQSDCAAFKSCTIGRKISKGDWSSVEDLCHRPEFTSLSGCKGFPAKATDWLFADIARKRDAGQVSRARCWDLKRFAKKVGVAQHKAAEILCREIDLTRIIVKVRRELVKARQSKYVPWFCHKANIARFSQPNTNYVKKLRAELAAICHKWGR